MARPSNSECSERERKSMKERKDEWAWKSIWMWWPLFSASGFAPCPCPCPWLLTSGMRGSLSPGAPLSSRQLRAILSTMRTVKKPAAMMNSGRGKLVWFDTNTDKWNLSRHSREHPLYLRIGAHANSCKATGVAATTQIHRSVLIPGTSSKELLWDFLQLKFSKQHSCFNFFSWFKQIADNLFAL